MLYFQRIALSDYLEIKTAVIVPCGRYTSPRISIYSVVLLLHFLDLLGSTLNWKQSIAQPRARRREGCFICQYLSWTDSIKSSMLFSNFRRCIAKGFLIRLFRDYNSCRWLDVPSGGHKMSLHISIQYYFYIFGPLGLWGVVCVWQEPFHLCIYVPFSKFISNSWLQLTANKYIPSINEKLPLTRVHLTQHIWIFLDRELPSVQLSFLWCTVLWIGTTENGVRHTWMNNTLFLMNTRCFHWVLWELEKWWWFLKVCASLALFVGIIETILMAYSRNIFPAYTHMFVFENNFFAFW